MTFPADGALRVHPDPAALPPLDGEPGEEGWIHVPSSGHRLSQLAAR